MSNTTSTNKRNSNYQFVNVYVRPRPLNQREIELRCPSVIQRVTDDELSIKNGLQDKTYRFDKVFREDSTQIHVYKNTVSPLIASVIAGYNCTVFAYGQTGTGKTHTMTGHDIGAARDFQGDNQMGVIPRAASQLFHELANLTGKIEYTVRVSYIEIYNEEVRDLLRVDNDTPLRIYDDPDNRGSITMRGLTEKTVCTVKQVCDWLDVGLIQRHTGATLLNRQSSRSHTVFTMLVHTRESIMDGEEVIKTGKLYLVDLAGSESIGRSGATEMRAREAGTINKSLLTLGKVIKALARSQTHVPYRDSKLTRILQDSLGGNTKTCMIATISPAVDAWDETLSTLDYACAARNVANTPHINESKQQTKVLTHLRQELVKLEMELKAARSGDGFYMSKEFYNGMCDDLANKAKEIEEQQRARMKLLGDIQELESGYEQKVNDYRKLEESFGVTRQHLSKIERDLREKELESKKDKIVLDYLDKRERDLSETANILLQVVEKATRKEGIYHSKYQNMCTLTTKNANTARTIAVMMSTAMAEMLLKAEDHYKKQEECLFDVPHIVKVIEENKDKIVECVVSLIKEIESVLNSAGPEIGGRPLSASLKDNGNLLTSELDACVTQFMNDPSLEDCAHNMEEIIRDGRTQRNVEAANMHAVISDGIKAEATHFNSLAEFEETVRSQLQSMRGLLDKVCTEMDKAAEKNETFSQRTLASTIQEQMLAYERSQNRFEERVEATANSFKDTVNAVKCRLGMDVVVRKNKLMGVTNDILSGLSAWSEQRRLKTGEFLGQVGRVATNCRDEVARTIQTGLANIHQAVESAGLTHRVHLTHLRDHVQGISTSVHNELTDKVVSEVHAGDTPVRERYEYPRHIQIRIPACVLQERLSDNDEGEPQQEAGD